MARCYRIKTLNDFLDVPYEHLDELCENLREGIEAMKHVQDCCREVHRCIGGDDIDADELILFREFSFTADGKRDLAISFPAAPTTEGEE